MAKCCNRNDRNSGAKVGYRLASFFGKVNYNWDDLLLASFTIRHDGSSRFGKAHRWGTFPAASLGFRFSNLLKKDWLDDAKLRLSWGQTGNQAIDNNAQFGLYVVDYGLDRVTSTASISSCKVQVPSLLVIVPHSWLTLT